MGSQRRRTCPGNRVNQASLRVEENPACGRSSLAGSAVSSFVPVYVDHGSTDAPTLTDPTVQVSTQRVPQVLLPAQFQDRVIQGSNRG